MAYCSNCGSLINNDIKFCPNCGAKIGTISKETKQASKNKMEKGVVKSLKKDVTDAVESKIKNTITKNPLEKKLFNESSSEIKDIDTEDKNLIKNKKTSKNLILIYILLNVLLFSFGQSSDEIFGLEFFTVVILVIYFIRHKKEKPFNWLLKIILILQLTLIFSFLMTSYEYFFSNFFSLLAGFSLLGLFIVILLLLFKGNKTQKL